MSQEAKYAPTDPQGWTRRLEFGRYNAIANGYLVPGRDGTAAAGFLTKGAPSGTGAVSEEYLYAVEITPSDVVIQGMPRMAPILDDVQVVYMLDSGQVIEEVEIVD